MTPPKLLLLCLWPLLAFAGQAAAATRYVTVGGSPAATGLSIPQAWSLAKAFTSALAGDLVLVQPGIYNGKFEITVSGTQAAPITFRADGAAGSVVINGTGQTSANDGLIFIRANNSKPLASDLNVEGFEIRNYLNASDASGIRILCQDNGIVRRIALKNCYIHDIRGTNAMGITVYGQSNANAITGITITGCEVANCDPSPSEALVFNGNVDGFTVQDSIVRDCNNIGIDMIGGEPGFPAGTAAQRAGKVARNGLVKGCRVSNIINAVNVSGAGIYVDGGRLITIEHCLVFSSDFGIEIGSENLGIITDGVTVRNNILRNNRFNALVVGGETTNNGRVNNCRFYHNLFYQNGTAEIYSSEIFLQNGSGNVFENNIIHPLADGEPSFLFVIDGNTSQTFRNNLWYIPGGSSTADGDFGWLPGNAIPCCGSYSEFRSVTGQDTGGLYANPSFLNPATGDYHLSPTSPARNAGITNPDLAAGLLTDLDGLPRVQGTAPDIGPDEAWPIDAWWRTAFPATPLAVAQLTADADGDGANNLLEYLGASLPASAASQPTFGPVVSTGQQGFYFDRSTTATDAELRLFTSQNLTLWSLSTAVPVPGAISSGRQRTTWTLPALIQPRVFLRGEARLKP
jgi:hypothetical protein